MKKIVSLFAAGIALAVSSSLAVPAFASEQSHSSSVVSSMSAVGNGTVKKSSVERFVKTATVNMRSGGSTNYRVIKVLKKNTAVKLTGKKHGAYVQVKSGNKTGWIHSSYLTTKKTTGSSPSNKPRKATAKEQKEWTSYLPVVCQNVPIKEFKQINPTRKDFSFDATSNIDVSGKFFYTININGKVKGTDPAAKALMKHECGHILTFVYAQQKGDNSYQKVMDKGWKSSDYMRDEKVADCIADRLGAVRETKGYFVGYGTKCSSTQKKVAQSFVDYSAKKK